MNRRKAILSFFLLGGGAATGIAGYKWYTLHKTPQLSTLESHTALIADLAETIIPATDTPGAKAVMAHLTIIKMIRETADRKTQNNFIEGLKTVEEYAGSQYGRPFTQLTALQQQQVIGAIAGKEKNYTGIGGKIRNKFSGKSFYSVLREYTAIAFCTSQSGATQTLSYNYIPGSYNGCIILQPGQHSWATK